MHTSAAVLEVISRIVHVSPTQKHCFLHTTVTLFKAISRVALIRMPFLQTTTTRLKAISRILHVNPA